jgi:hypothetical protein
MPLLGWRYGSSDRVPASQVQSPKFKPQYYQNKSTSICSLLKTLMFRVSNISSLAFYPKLFQNKVNVSKGRQYMCLETSYASH